MEKKQLSFLCLGISFKSASTDYRESTYLSRDELLRALEAKTNFQPFHETLILVTCNRMEIYGVSKSNKEEALEKIYGIFLHLLRKSGKTNLPNLDEFKEKSYLHKDHDAVRHLFCVVSSLDSLIIGETQIVGQFKEALELFQSFNLLGPYLQRLSQEALALNKKIRSETEIGQGTTSISHAAFDLAKLIFSDMKERKVVIVGAGEMAQLAALYAKNHEPQEIFIVNRSLGRANDLVEYLGCGESYLLSELERLLKEVDIVICSATVTVPLIGHGVLRSVMKARKGRPLFIADIAIPRNVDSACSAIEDVYLFELDDLKKIVAKNKNKRQQDYQKALDMIELKTNHFDQWLSELELGPAIKNFKTYLETLTYKEFHKTMSKSMFSNLTHHQFQALDRMMKSISSKIAGDAAKVLLDENYQAMRSNYLLSLDTLFKTEKHEKEHIWKGSPLTTKTWEEKTLLQNDSLVQD